MNEELVAYFDRRCSDFKSELKTELTSELKSELDRFRGEVADKCRRVDRRVLRLEARIIG